VQGQSKPSGILLLSVSDIYICHYRFQPTYVNFRKCQKIDWKNRHRNVCGEVLTLETAESSFTPYQHAPSESANLSPPENEKIGPPIAPFKRSAYLTPQVSLLNLNAKADYFLRINGDYRQIDFPLDSQEGRGMSFYFRKCRQLALTTGDRLAITVLAQTLCDCTTEAKDINRELILKQIAQEFEWEGVSDAVERLNKLKSLKGTEEGRGLYFLAHTRKWISEFQELERQR
jgi:hypothetical protein